MIAAIPELKANPATPPSISRINASNASLVGLPVRAYSYLKFPIPSCLNVLAWDTGMETAPVFLSIEIPP